jgi:OOP family OmpA-OmpF porin
VPKAERPRHGLEPENRSSKIPRFSTLFTTLFIDKLRGRAQPPDGFVSEPCSHELKLNFQLKGNKMKKFTLAVMAIVGLAGATTAFASDDGWYVFGAVGKPTSNNDKSTLDNALTSVGGTGFSSSISSSTVYNLDVGYQVNKNFAIEGGYLGSTNENYSASGGNLSGPLTSSANIKGWTLAAVGILPLANQFSLLGKLGVAGIKDSATVTGPGGSVSVSGTKNALTYGIGVKYDFTNAASMRLSLDNYDVGDSSSSSRGSVWTVGVGYKF